MRILHDHKTNPANDVLTITVMDEPGAGGASHLYRVSGFAFAGKGDELMSHSATVELLFQNGPINEVGVNGLTHEVLLAVVADRLRSFQKGPYACRENALALTRIKEALHWLKHRTRARMARGVEGTHEL